MNDNLIVRSSFLHLRLFDLNIFQSLNKTSVACRLTAGSLHSRQLEWREGVPLARWSSPMQLHPPAGTCPLPLVFTPKHPSFPQMFQIRPIHPENWFIVLFEIWQLSHAQISIKIPLAYLLTSEIDACLSIFERRSWLIKELIAKFYSPSYW